MENLYEKEKIGAIKNEMSHIWGAIFILGGGSITFAVTEISILKLFFIIFGTLLTILFINAYFKRKDELLVLLKKLSKEK